MKTTKSLFGILTISVCLPFGQKIEASSFLTTGPMSNARYTHTATLLTNGLVLVAGGQGSGSGQGDPLSSAELYNPINGTWTPTNSMISARWLHTATLFTNGQVLVAGGYNISSGYLSSAELYNPATGQWTATGSLQTARYGHTATLLPNGKVLVASGQNPAWLSSAELYDPVSGQWTTTGSLNAARADFTATLLPDGTVIVAGGRDVSGTSLSSVELYNPATGTWTPTNGLNVARSGHTATLLPNGVLLVAGGITNYNSETWLASAELYNPATGTWTPTGSLNTARDYHTATLLPNGQVLATAGNGVGNLPLSSAELYNSATGSWTLTSSLNAGRWYYTATMMPNGLVLMAGGTDAAYIALSSAEVYVPDPLVTLIKAVEPSFSSLAIGTNYQLQISTSLSGMFTNYGSPFAATEHHHELSAIL